jgi:hypothetical protein
MRWRGIRAISILGSIDREADKRIGGCRGDAALLSTIIKLSSPSR